MEPKGETILAAHGRSHPFLSSEKILKVSVKDRKVCNKWYRENLHKVAFEDKGKGNQLIFYDELKFSSTFAFQICPPNPC